MSRANEPKVEFAAPFASDGEALAVARAVMINIINGWPNGLSNPAQLARQWLERDAATHLGLKVRRDVDAG